MTIENIGKSTSQIIVREDFNKIVNILAIDDDETNLDVLNHTLEEYNHFKVAKALDGDEGLEYLTEHPSEVDIILLDKMMPRMDGITFLKHIKTDPKLCNIPVIMQTAAVGSNDMKEGIEAGAYYYITKPFEGDILISIINAACIDQRKHSLLERKIHDDKAAFDMIHESTFHFQTMEEAHILAGHIANYFPNPANTAIGLLELLINAVEHGNLGIGYNLKSELIADNRLHHEIYCRLNLIENKDKHVTVLYERLPNQYQVTIKDCGEGFFHKKYMDFDPIRMTETNGRGIAKANVMSFDKIEYNEKGNSVCCIVYDKKDDTTNL